MNKVHYFFMNLEENRLRVGYRIVIQLAAYLLIYELLKYSFIPGGTSDNTLLNASLYIIILLGVFKFTRAWLVIFLASKYIEKRPLSSFGLKISMNWWEDLFVGLLMGAISIASLVFLQYCLGWITFDNIFHTVFTERSFISSIASIFIYFALAAASEEIFNRGYLLTTLSDAFYSPKISREKATLLAVFISSVLFGAMHIGNANVNFIAITNIIIGGALFSTLFIYSGQLGLAIGYHAAWNFFQASVFGLPVSGKTWPADIVSTATSQQTGPEIWTGGEFGPEAGLLALFVWLFSIPICLLWIKYRKGNLQVKLEFFTDQTLDNSKNV